MGTWDVGPFDNDTAADFGGHLDQAPEGERGAMVRDALVRALDDRGDLDQDIAVVAIAAAALVAGQCPQGEPVTTAYGPAQPVPRLPDDLRALAVQVLDRVVAEPSELMELWDETDDAGAWRESLVRLRTPLLPPVLQEPIPLTRS
ncbi:DUF4259 domain-containing protein [Streptomyces sp. NPDC014894]|uniref:DUF4259 domain-containing protein n=1 Tax=unclassified Streptomyces TaxID=2593676 RepID=UPI0036F52AD9